MKTRVAAFAAALLFALCPVSALADAASDEAATSAYLDSIRTAPARLAAFVAAMPKGADLHNHATGAVYAEDYFAWARQDDGCYDPSTYALAPKPCAPPMRPLAQGIAEDPNLAKRVIEALSMANFWPSSPNAGHDHFFATFNLFGSIAGTHYNDVLAAATEDAARSHASVLELMVSAGSSAVNAMTAQLQPVFSSTDFAADTALLDRSAFDAALAAARTEMRDMEAGRRRAMHCGTRAARPACDVDVHYLLQVTRTAAPAHVFAQARLAFALGGDSTTRVAGINFVAPEDDPVAVRDYDLHMQIVRFLRGLYPAAHVSLHAGELTPAIAPPAALRAHIREAVEVAGAERIGHGVDVLGEQDPEGLLREMAARHVLVEIALTSNDVILNIRGTAHPLPAYLAHGVPAALVTDDPGVARSDLDAEYLRAETTYALSYATLKTLARNSVAYAFLPGVPLWSDTTYAHRAAACAASVPGEGAPQPACAAFLAGSEHAAAEFALEADLHAFEHTEAQAAAATR